MKAWTTLAVSTALLFVGCSSEAGNEPERLDVELRSEMRYDDPVGTFEAHGAAVDEGLLCGSGQAIWQRSEHLDGKEFTDDDLSDLWDAGDPFEFVVVIEYECENGSVVLAEQASLDPATPDRPGDVVGTWTVRSGEIAGVSVAGNGEIIGGETIRDNVTLQGYLVEATEAT